MEGDCLRNSRLRRPLERPMQDLRNMKLWGLNSRDLGCALNGEPERRKHLLREGTGAHAFGSI
eukprot:7200051-Heterocapsa_arctica.AAC.1